MIYQYIPRIKLEEKKAEKYSLLRFKLASKTISFLVGRPRIEFTKFEHQQYVPLRIGPWILPRWRMKVLIWSFLQASRPWSPQSLNFEFHARFVSDVVNGLVCKIAKRPKYSIQLSRPLWIYRHLKLTKSSRYLEPLSDIKVFDVNCNGSL